MLATSQASGNAATPMAVDPQEPLKHKCASDKKTEEVLFRLEQNCALLTQLSKTARIERIDQANKLTRITAQLEGRSVVSTPDCCFESEE
jgi:hypothetical protein